MTQRKDDFHEAIARIVLAMDSGDSEAIVDEITAMSESFDINEIGSLLGSIRVPRWIVKEAKNIVRQGMRGPLDH